MELEEVQTATRDMQNGLALDVRRLDGIVCGGINLQCINSSDFIVGKQTNFNGPVTIINCTNVEAIPVKKPNSVVSAPREEQSTALSDDPKASCPERMCKRRFLKIPAAMWLIAAMVTIAGCATLLAELSANEDDPTAEGVGVLEGRDDNYTLFGRRHWQAEPEKSSVRMRLPVRYVIVRSTGGRTCAGLRDCGDLLRGVQRKEQARTRSDIYANFLVASDGSVYEGRGWTKRNAFRGFANSRSLDVCLVGEFEDGGPTERQVDAARAIVARGLQMGVIGQSYSVVAGNETDLLLPDGVAVVGGELYSAVKDWPRFEPRPYENLYGRGLV